jgi:uncharacterized protein YbjT (DUF2867 family)
MKILIFGATGGTGRHLVAQALAQDHEVTAYTRPVESLRRRHTASESADGARRAHGR